MNKKVDLKELRDNIKKIAGTSEVYDVPLTVFEAKILSIDSDGYCIVDSISDNIDIEDFRVRYNLYITDGESKEPDIDSTVLVGFNPYIIPFIFKYTDLKDYSIYIGNQSYYIDGEKQIFNDGAYGGLPIVKSTYNGESEKGLLAKIKQLEETLNSVNKRLDSFISVFSAPTWTVLPQDGGLALQTAIEVWSPTSQSVSDINPIIKEEDITNSNILHGKIVNQE